MRYSLFAGGKRIRPVLCCEAAATISDHTPGILDAAASLELIHITPSSTTTPRARQRRPPPRPPHLSQGFRRCHGHPRGDALLTLAFQVLSS